MIKELTYDYIMEESLRRYKELPRLLKEAEEAMKRQKAIDVWLADNNIKYPFESEEDRIFFELTWG